MTVRLYYDDCYLRSFNASVVDASEDRTRLYLDRTAFYPASGGQPHDVGAIESTPVVTVEDEGERIAHILASPLAAREVRCEIDWTRRYDHMQQHTGQHLLSAVCEELFAFRTLSFQMGAELSTIELETKELTDAQIAAIEDRVNALARAALPVRIGYEQAEAASDLRKASNRSGELRIVTIDGFDRSACGGTHVASTAELSPIQIRRQDKVRRNTRIEFVCGARAVERMRRDYRLAADAARQAACSLDDLPGAVAQLRTRLTDATKERSKMAAELARFEGEELYRNTVPDADGVRRATIRADAIDDLVRVRLTAYASGRKAVALALGQGIAIHCSLDSGVNAGAVLKAVLGKYGGRGGGSASAAQGSLPDAQAIAELAAALGFSST